VNQLIFGIVGLNNLFSDEGTFTGTAPDLIDQVCVQEIPLYEGVQVASVKTGSPAA
jgi:hypothetical protein